LDTYLQESALRQLHPLVRPCPSECSCPLCRCPCRCAWRHDPALMMPASADDNKMPGDHSRSAPDDGSSTRRDVRLMRTARACSRLDVRDATEDARPMRAPAWAHATYRRSAKAEAPGNEARIASCVDACDARRPCCPSVGVARGLVPGRCRSVVWTPAGNLFVHSHRSQHGPNTADQLRSATQ